MPLAMIGPLIENAWTVLPAKGEPQMVWTPGAAAVAPAAPPASSPKISVLTISPMAIVAPSPTPTPEPIPKPRPKPPLAGGAGAVGAG